VSALRVSRRAVATAWGLPVGVRLALGWIALVVLLAIFSPLLPIDDPAVSDPLAIASGPSADHWFGTDPLGRDIFARTIVGGRVSLLVGAGATLLALVAGGTAGLLAGARGGIFDRLASGAADAALAFPGLVILIVLVAVVGATIPTLVIGLGLIASPGVLRIARAQAMSLRRREFVTSARALGARPGQVVFGEIGPNVMPVVMAYSMVMLALLIVAEGSLSFLGLGVPPPAPSWGGIIAVGRTSLDRAPHIALIPGLVLWLTVLSLSVVGEYFQRRVAGTDS
jgi:peptide/nickel transport system permease protein